MIIEQQAKESSEVSTKVELYCPNCSRDVSEAELIAKRCNDCDADLSTPEQHVAVAVVGLPVVGITW